VSSRVAVAWLLLLSSGWIGPRARTEVRGVVIVTLDTTRVDYISAYGSTHVSTPSVDGLARTGVLFEQAATVAPLTLTAHSSLFTGLLPPHHGVRDNAADPLATHHVTLAEIVHRRGFRTAAFVGSGVLDKSRGLARGFDVYGDGVSEVAWNRRLRRPGAAVVAEATRWLNCLDDSPFLLWVHLYDAHAPYDPPEPYRSLYRDDRYAAAVAYEDAQVGVLFDGLERRGLLSQTAIILAADHGEALGEHEERGHGLQLYENVLHVPLIIRTAGVRPQRHSSVVSLVDVMPTVLDLLGQTTPVVDGRSLVPTLTGKTQTSSGDAYAESMYPARLGRRPLRAWRDERFKLIDATPPELYDLERDPDERQNLIAEQPHVAEGLFRRLASIDPSASRRMAPSGLGPVPSDLRNRLAALGYASRD
jgi:arylsulfatase A-like enzyme